MTIGDRVEVRYQVRADGTWGYTEWKPGRVIAVGTDAHGSWACVDTDDGGAWNGRIEASYIRAGAR